MANAQNIWFGQKKSDPKRRFRFILNINYKDKAGRSAKVPVYYVKTATKPKATVSTVEHSFLSYNFKYPGRVTWDNVTVTLDYTSDEMSEISVEFAFDWAECAGTTNAQPLSRRAP